MKDSVGCCFRMKDCVGCFFRCWATYVAVLIAAQDWKIAKNTIRSAGAFNLQLQVYCCNCITNTMCLSIFSVFYNQPGGLLFQLHSPFIFFLCSLIIFISHFSYFTHIIIPSFSFDTNMSVNERAIENPLYVIGDVRDKLPMRCFQVWFAVIRRTYVELTIV